MFSQKLNQPTTICSTNSKIIYFLTALSKNMPRIYFILADTLKHR